jgi:hypothetical protein
MSRREIIANLAGLTIAHLACLVPWVLWIGLLGYGLATTNGTFSVYAIAGALSLLIASVVALISTSFVRTWIGATRELQ